MTPRPLGATVRLYVDLREQVFPGDAIETQTGRLYLVVAVRVQERGKHRGRQHLTCVVAEPPAPPEIKIHRIRWYPRPRRPRT